MPKHTNVVRFKVKAGKQAEFEELFKSADKWDGMLMHVLAKTGDQTYVGYGLWESEGKMQGAMPEMISLLDSTRHLWRSCRQNLVLLTPSLGLLCTRHDLLQLRRLA